MAPSIDAVMALVDERERDARAQKDTVDGWIKVLKQAHDTFPEPFWTTPPCRRRASM